MKIQKLSLPCLPRILHQHHQYRKFAIPSKKYVHSPPSSPPPLLYTHTAGIKIPGIPQKPSLSAAIAVELWPVKTRMGFFFWTFVFFGGFPALVGNGRGR